VDIILSRLKRTFSKEITGIHPSILEAFMRYSWPGNIREMENLLERAFILESSPILTPESFPAEIIDPEKTVATTNAFENASLAEIRKHASEEAERRYLRVLLKDHKGRINSSAEAAGISTRQLHKLMTKYGIRKEEYKS
jgi:DNA-binding NtrC family response regulator